MPVRKITVFSVKHERIKIPDLTKTPQGNCTPLKMVTRNFFPSLCERVKFCSVYYAQLLTDGRAAIQRRKGQEVGEVISAAVGKFYWIQGCQIRRGQNTWSWLFIVTSTVN